MQAHRTNPSNQLPTPSPELIAHSAGLSAQIHQMIAKAGGAIGFDQFMDTCLYWPGLGYYSAGLRKFGRGGDFVTAPELGAIFARAIAVSIAPLLQAHRDWAIVEVGCGTGALAYELLSALQELDALPASYQLLERSAELRERQQHRLAPIFALTDIRWLDAPPLASWSGILLGNEIIDALACKRFEVTSEGACELIVRSLGDGFAYGLGAPVDLNELIEIDPLSLPLGNRYEFLPQLSAWLAGLTEQLQKGLVLMFDYGYPRADYYAPDRRTGSLVCHYQQRMFDDPFWYPGLVDISASVDFTAVALAGRACQLELASYLTQSEFILTSAQVWLAEQFAAASPYQQVKLSTELRTLTLPGEMGERVQLIALQKAMDDQDLPAVFQQLGWRHRL
jgi:SAM-dependent MidA family methyltransferase